MICPQVCFGPAFRSSLCWALMLLWFWPQALCAQNSTSAVPKPDWIDPPPFEYTARDKIDPFASFVRSQGQEAEGQDRPERTLGPLERVEPSQLKLVGVLRAPSGKRSLALVELPNGKGYILRPGMAIGRNQGRVTRIEPRQVVIVEEQTTVLGQQAAHSVTLTLPGPPGEDHEP